MQSGDVKLISMEDYRARTREMRRTLFRLQLHPVYRVTREDAELQRFLETGAIDVDPDDEFLATLRQRKAEGRPSHRVYVVTPPLTDYQRFAFAYYHHTSLAGEDFRIIDSTTMTVPSLPDHDFMLIDEETLIKVHYGPDGTFIGPELLESADINEYIAYQNEAIAASVPFLDYEESLKT